MPGKRYSIKWIITTILVSGCFLITILSPGHPLHSSVGVTPTVEYYKATARDFAAATAQLQEAVALVSNKDPQTIVKAQQALKRCRLQYKKIEFFLEYFFRSSALIYNSPPKYEIEEPYMEYQTPIGLQVIESLLFEKDVTSEKEELQQQAEVINSSAQDLQSLVYEFTADDRQILESVRLELIRVYALGITGFDAPLLKSGIEESYEALNGINYVMAPFLRMHAPHADSVTYYLQGCLQYLKAGVDFDTFNRLRFLTGYALPLQRQIGCLIREMQLELNTTQGVLNYKAEHLFSKDAINLDVFPTTGATVNAALIKLGKSLFYEPALSGNNRISCVTCHQPAKYFTDGLPRSVAFDGHTHVKRNAPSLLYAGFQYAQFWDGRAKSLEAQVKEVIANPLEMNGNYNTAIHLLQGRDKYTELFKMAFPPATDSLITTEKIAAAIATFIRTLNPRNAPFDRYITGDTTAMSSAQKHGFNLFMGKAQCGTCHFAPLFNGLVPPLYNLTELEVLGITKTDDFNKPEADTDNGRFNIFPIEYYEKAFKTPTVRNASATAPYMHNGAFQTLEGVMTFYNKGGGRGLGLHTEQQTLAAIPLQLTASEMNDIVSFMNALKDSILN